MKLEENSTFLPLGISYRVVSENGLIPGPFYYTKREALVHWLEGIARELSDGRCSEESVIAALRLEEIETTKL